jgi:murein DD-endopeptidase MepM/ murein hydrolase activator NlpD
VNSESLVPVQVPQSIADLWASMTEDEILHVRKQRHWTHRVMVLLEVILIVFCVVAAFYIWGPIWDWRESIYENAMMQCSLTLSSAMETTHLNIIVKTDDMAKTCLDLTKSLKPPDSSPWSRAKEVWSWVATPVGDWLEGIFLPDHKKNLDTTSGGSLGSVDYSTEGDSLGNPTLRAVIQEAIRISPDFSVPWRFVVDACYYDSGGLRQYAADGVLVQGKNLDSTDWGLCQINDKWNPTLMDAAKGSWKTNLRAGFIVMNARWADALQHPDGEYRLRYLWGRYNGSGPYDTYATRVLGVHNLLGPKIEEILRGFEEEKSQKTAQSAASPDSAQSVSSDWSNYWSKCRNVISNGHPCGFPLPGDPNSYIKGTAANGGKGFHDGAWDYWLKDKTSTTVYSVVGGKVTGMGRFNNGGTNGGTTYLIISSGECRVTYYHMPLDTMPKAGSDISWGDSVGQLGTEGTSAWIHLHWEVDCGAGSIQDHEQFWEPYR